MELGKLVAGRSLDYTPGRRSHGQSRAVVGLHQFPKTNSETVVGSMGSVDGLWDAWGQHM